MTRILEFLRINLEFLEIASVALLPLNDTENSRIPRINLEFLGLKNTPAPPKKPKKAKKF